MKIIADTTLSTTNGIHVCSANENYGTVPCNWQLFSGEEQTA
jgi:hypothetical protein